MSHVSYNGSRLIPSPIVRISKQYQKDTAGKIIGKLYSLEINGTLLPWKGSPNSSKVFWTSSGYPPDETLDADEHLSSILRKQEAIRDLFSTEGLQFEIQALDASAPMKCNPRIISIEFPQDIWYNKFDYVIVLEADELYPMQEDTFDEYISDANEDWEIQTLDDQPEDIGKPRTYTLTHTVSAIGKRFYDENGVLVKEACEQARDYVLPRLGIDSIFNLSSGTINLPSYYSGYNHVRNTTQHDSEGSFAVTETWILSSGTALETLSINTDKDIETGLTRVTLDGNINGLEIRDSNLALTTTKYDNAVSKFTNSSGLALSRAQNYSGLTLNILPINTSIVRNPTLGTIQYTFVYDTRPSNIISGSLSEVIDVNDSLRGNAFASIFVLGRANGPVLQNLNTTQSLVRTLNIEAVMGPQSFGSNTESDLRTAFNNNPRVNPATSGDVLKIIDAVDPSKNGFTIVYYSPPQETWEPRNGRYRYTREWTYQ